ncbi:Zinc finger protein 182 [Araneus ventricosus]|uniref:Zinc finger protein 182 n=1 Tax=Araneus ventricosus TaxID=182803 RepID=A0A4Y2I6Q5_ARAVE|nr:Zinc finger protein 182 [Araneus ventricosus]
MTETTNFVPSADDTDANLRSGVMEDSYSSAKGLANPCCSVPTDKNFSRKYYGERRHAQIKRKIVKCHKCKENFIHKLRFKPNSSEEEESKQYCDHCLQKKNMFQCNLCHKSFGFKSWLAIHYRSHLKLRPYTCELCGRSFARKQVLRCHYRTHTGEKPYCCDICGKNFTQKSNLIMHNRKHLNEKLCECYMCKKIFVHRFKIGQERYEDSAANQYYCDLCKESRDIFEKLSKPLEMFTQKNIFLNLPALI